MQDAFGFNHFYFLIKASSCKLWHRFNLAGVLVDSMLTNNFFKHHIYDIITRVKEKEMNEINYGSRKVGIQLNLINECISYIYVRSKYHTLFDGKTE